MLTINSCAVIAEYNPFHNGHALHIEKTKETVGNVPIICIMSGSFTQRGEPAIVDKWTRASWAINNGCDLVLELPVVFSTQSANRFCFGGVEIVKGLGADGISFGSETDNIGLLNSIVDYRQTEEYKQKLSSALNNGNSFAKAVEIALDALPDDAKKAQGNPNCILALEYLSAIKGSCISPVIVKRNNDYKDGAIKSDISSATAVRKAVLAKDSSFKSCVPKEVFEYLSDSKPQTLSLYFPLLLEKIFALKEEGLSHIHDITEGLENRIYKQALKAKSLEELLESIKTKRYLYVRLQRIMVYILLDIRKSLIKELDGNSLKSYGKILAINNKGAEFLSKTKADIPVITKVADYKTQLDGLGKRVFEKDLFATSMYSIFSDIRANEDFLYNSIKK